MARKKKLSKTIVAAKKDLQRRAEEEDDTTLQDLQEARRERDLAKGVAKVGLDAARNAYRGGNKSLVWTEAGREIVKRMRTKRSDYGRGYYVGEGDIAMVRKHISKYETYSGYGTHDIPAGAIVIITSSPYNPYGDGLRIDVLHGAESVQGVKLAKLVQIRKEEEDEI